jgi:hypothetical protein
VCDRQDRVRTPLDLINRGVDVNKFDGWIEGWAIGVAIEQNRVDLVKMLLDAGACNVFFLNVMLPRCYWTKLSEWQPEWLLDTDNAEVRRVLIQQVGYKKICARLGAKAIDSGREYTLLKIDGLEPIYDEDGEPLEKEPMLLLKMICPSTGHIHILRVPPRMESAEAAITWVNHRAIPF